MSCASSGKATTTEVVAMPWSVAAGTRHIGAGSWSQHTSAERSGTVWAASLLSHLGPEKVVGAGEASRSPEEECELPQEASIVFAQ